MPSQWLKVTRFIPGSLSKASSLISIKLYSLLKWLACLHRLRYKISRAVISKQSSSQAIRQSIRSIIHSSRTESYPRSRCPSKQFRSRNSRTSWRSLQTAGTYSLLKETTRNPSPNGPPSKSLHGLQQLASETALVSSSIRRSMARSLTKQMRTTWFQQWE